MEHEMRELSVPCGNDDAARHGGSRQVIWTWTRRAVKDPPCITPAPACCTALHDGQARMREDAIEFTCAVEPFALLLPAGRMLVR